MRPPQVVKAPGRVWLYPRGSWDGPLVLRSGDEYGRVTLAFRLPGHRGLVIAYRWCNDPSCCDRCPVTGYPHSAWIGGEVQCVDCAPPD